MFKNILVPVDFLDDNAQAVEIAVNVALQNKGNVTLFHVIEFIADAEFKEFERFYSKLEKRSHTDMETLMIPHLDSGVHIEKKIVYGNRTEEILKHVENHHIDLIVMSSHKIDFDNPTAGWGTISHKIGILAQCPVMLVK